ncbi:MAG: murein transglycosylase A [Rhodospirillales bacterium]|nr:murein transglycosylase A [Rhodospirillales bacterium]
MRWRPGPRLAAIAALVSLLAGCAAPQAPGIVGPPGQLTLNPVAFTALPGWRHDHLARAIPALLRSCARMRSVPPDEALGGGGQAASLAGTAGQWLHLCEQAAALPDGDDPAARAFLEKVFQPYAMSDGTARTGLFTGYYEPEVAGSLSREGPYQTPLLGRPHDLIWPAPPNSGLKAGRIAGGRLVAYYTRAEIERGVLDRQHLAIVWLKSPIDAFFLQVQGAGRVRLPDGRILRVGFAGQNGRPYVPIGRVLVQRGDLAENAVSAPSIRAWLTAHPGAARGVMDANPSYVFFRILPDLPPDEGSPGALGVALTPARSLAVDRDFVPLGAPVYVATTNTATGRPFDHLMLAQDLGSAIRGPIRGDIYFGWGPDAAREAGLMHSQGRAFLLLPRAIADAANTAAPGRAGKVAARDLPAHTPRS